VFFDNHYHDRQLPPSPEKFQFPSHYLARAFVGRKISDGGGRGAGGADARSSRQEEIGTGAADRYPGWILGYKIFEEKKTGGGWGHGAGCRHSRQEARSGRVWPTSWRRTRGCALPPSCAPLCLCFSRQLFPQNQKVIRRLDPKANLISPDLHHHDSYLVPNENFFVFLQGQN